MLNPPISEKVTLVLHSGARSWPDRRDIRGAACISWTQNPALRPPHPLDSSSSSAPRDCWWLPWRKREKSPWLSQWYLDDGMMIVDDDTGGSTIILYFISPFHWCSQLMLLVELVYKNCDGISITCVGSMNTWNNLPWWIGVSHLTIYILQPDWWKWAKKVASWVMPTEKSTAINDHQGAPSWARKDTLWFLQKWLKFGIPRIHLKSGSWT